MPDRPRLRFRVTFDAEAGQFYDGLARRMGIEPAEVAIRIALDDDGTDEPLQTALLAHTAAAGLTDPAPPLHVRAETGRRARDEALRDDGRTHR